MLSRELPVPLVAEEKALLRVFVTARKATSEGIPLVRARFYLGGRETHVEDIPGKSTRIPTEVDESSLSKSANAEISAEVNVDILTERVDRCLTSRPRVTRGAERVGPGTTFRAACILPGVPDIHEDS